MIAVLPLKAANALPVASAAASCSGVTSVTAFHCASLFTRKTAWYPAFASARKRSARSWKGDFDSANAGKPNAIKITKQRKRKRKIGWRCMAQKLVERGLRDHGQLTT